MNVYEALDELQANWPPFLLPTKQESIDTSTLNAKIEKVFCTELVHHWQCEDEVQHTTLLCPFTNAYEIENRTMHTIDACTNASQQLWNEEHIYINLNAKELQNGLRALMEKGTITDLFVFLKERMHIASHATRIPEGINDVLDLERITQSVITSLRGLWKLKPGTPILHTTPVCSSKRPLRVKLQEEMFAVVSDLCKNMNFPNILPPYAQADFVPDYILKGSIDDLCKWLYDEYRKTLEEALSSPE